MHLVQENDPRLLFVPEEKATTPPAGIIEHLKDRYWIVHPTKGLVYWLSSGLVSPQCNRDESVTKTILGKMYPWAEVKQIPSVFRKINPRDYV